MNKITIKMFFIFSIIFYFMIVENSLCSNVSIPISQPLTPDNKKSVQGLLSNINSYPAVQIDSTTNRMTQIPVTRLSRFMLPSGTVSIMQKSNLSVLRPTNKDLYTNYPAGATLFEKNSDVAGQFDAIISSIKANNELIKFFRKIHFNCLNQLYNYLMSVHTNLVSRNVGSSYDANGNMQLNLQQFIVDDVNYATNQKTLIVSFLINIIESQFHEMIRACAPTLPYLFATPTGKMLIQNDFSVDLTSFAKPSTDEVTQHLQSTYFDFLKNYITFFKLYTDLLTKPDTKTGFTEFTTVAENMIEKKLIETMNPLMFFYNDESLYAIKMIPHITTELPQESNFLNWSETVVNAATKGTMSKKHPVAYFTDAENKKTSEQSQASHLFLLSDSGSNIFEQELLGEPKWLNSSSGVITMLKACLGDFSNITNLNILDPFTQGIIEKTLTGSINPATLSKMDKLTAIVTPAPKASTSTTNNKS